MELKVKVLQGARVPLPDYQSDGAAGIDLHAALESPVRVAPGTFEVIPTGIAVEIPEGHWGMVAARSGLAVKHGIGLLNGVGVIDSDYRGQIYANLINNSGVPFNVMPGDRVAQMLVLGVQRVAILMVDELSETARGEAGLGSTGR